MESRIVRQAPGAEGIEEGAAAAPQRRWIRAAQASSCARRSEVRGRRLGLSIACMIAAVGASRATLAHPPIFIDSASEARAAVLRSEGTALSREGRIPEAIEAYTAAIRLQETCGVAANLGNLELVVGRHRDAAEHLALAERLCAEEASPPVREALRQRAEEARKHVGALKIGLSVDKAEVSVDGRPVDARDLGAEIFVETGSHTVEARSEGYAAGRETVALSAGELRALWLTLAPLGPVAGPATKAARVEDGGTGKSVPLLVAGAGAATTGAVLGVLFTVAANAKSEEAAPIREELRARAGEGACSRPSSADAAGCERLLGLRDDQRALSTAALWSFVTAGAFAAGVGVYALWPASGGGRGPGARVRAIPVAGARGGGLVVAARF